MCLELKSNVLQRQRQRHKLKSQKEKESQQSVAARAQRARKGRADLRRRRWRYDRLHFRLLLRTSTGFSSHTWVCYGCDLRPKESTSFLARRKESLKLHRERGHLDLSRNSSAHRRQPKLLTQHVVMTTKFASGSRQIVHLKVSGSRSICDAFAANSLTLNLMSFTSDCNASNFSSIVLVAFCIGSRGLIELVIAQCPQRDPSHGL